MHECGIHAVVTMAAHIRRMITFHRLHMHDIGRSSPVLFTRRNKPSWARKRRSKWLRTQNNKFDRILLTVDL